MWEFQRNSIRAAAERVVVNVDIGRCRRGKRRVGEYVGRLGIHESGCF